MMKGEHTVRKSSHTSTWWNGNSACGEKDPAATHVVITPAGSSYPEFTFRVPAERGPADDMGRAMDAAYEAGIQAAKSSIRKALGFLV